MSDKRKPSSALTVASGGARTGRQPRAKKSRRKASPRNPLAESRQPEKSPNLVGLNKLFQEEADPRPDPGKFPAEPAPSPENSSAGEPANEDVRRRLDGIPDVIGGEVVGEQEAEITSDEIRELMVTIQFAEEDVKAFLGEAFDWMAELMGSDHWKLTERQSRMLAGPLARVMGSIWLKLLERLPDVIVKWCEQTPGAAAFLLTLGIVVLPKGTKQIRIWKERRVGKTIDAKPETKREPAKHEPARQTSSGSGPIPVATGIVGGN